MHKAHCWGVSQQIFVGVRKQKSVDKFFIQKNCLRSGVVNLRLYPCSFSPSLHRITAQWSIRHSFPSIGSYMFNVIFTLKMHLIVKKQQQQQKFPHSLLLHQLSFSDPSIWWSCCCYEAEEEHKTVCKNEQLGFKNENISVIRGYKRKYAFS